MMALDVGLVLLKAGLRAFIVGDWTTAEYVTDIAARCDASHWVRSSSSSDRSKCAKM